jgi:predicted metalloprotease with PDZ domain
VATLLDSPILLGKLRQWSFVEEGTTFHVVYWPLPNATPFDTTAFVDGLRRLTHEAVAIFGRAPTANYYFLFQDGAQDALEHTASVSVGLPSEELARNPHARSLEIAHELFHTWNLVAIRPDRYGELSYRPTQPTTALWWSEGVTLYYADALTRRARIADTTRSRLDRLRNNLRAYHSAWWTTRVSPERASLAFGVSPLADSNATGGYYTQGELLAHELDALIRDSTRESRSLEDVMRAMFARTTPRRGFTAAELEAVTDSVCGCRLDAVFANQVRGHAPIDVRPALTRLGLKLLVDTTVVVNDSGAQMPDLRISMDSIRLYVPQPASAWRRAGLRTGDELISINKVPIATFAEMRRVLVGLRVGQTVVVEIRRAGKPMQISVPVTGYVLPRMRFVDVEGVTPEQRARRERWMEGR